MKKPKTPRVIVANDPQNGQSTAFIAAAGYGKDRNYLDSPKNSGQVHPENINNQETSDRASLNSQRP